MDRRRRYVVCPCDELVRDGFKQVAAISCRFNNPISRKTRLSLTRATFKFFFGPSSLLASDKYFFKNFPSKNKGARVPGAPPGSANVSRSAARSL